MEMYKRNNSRIQNLIKNIDLHILHSMNPDGFEKAEQVCKSKIGRSNANGVSKIQTLKVFEQKGDLLNFKANIDPISVAKLSQAEPS